MTRTEGGIGTDFSTRAYLMYNDSTNQVTGIGPGSRDGATHGPGGLVVGREGDPKQSLQHTDHLAKNGAFDGVKNRASRPTAMTGPEKTAAPSLPVVLLPGVSATRGCGLTVWCPQPATPSAPPDT